MKVETPSNGSRPEIPVQPVPEQQAQVPEQPVVEQAAPHRPAAEPQVSSALPEWSTTWPPPAETPEATTPVSEQARVQPQAYDVNPAPPVTPQYTPAPGPAATTPMPPYTPAPAPTAAPAYTPAYVEPRRERAHESSGLIWPILLITAGVVLLLNTLGILSWTVWNGIWRLWPLVLIFIGLELLFGRRSRMASYVIAGLAVLTIAGLAMAWSVLPWTGGVINQQPISQPVSGATSADVEISLGVGDLTVNPLANPGGDIMQGTIALGSNERLERNYTVNGGVGRLTLANRSVEGVWFGNVSSGPRTHTINLNPTIPMSLKVDGGVGDTRLNLADFNLRRLEVNSGVGKVEATLPAMGTSDAFIHGGVGEVILNVPEGTALQVHATQGLGSSIFPSSYEHVGDVWTSPGYDTAANRIRMQVTGGVGSLTVRETSR